MILKIIRFTIIFFIAIAGVHNSAYAQQLMHDSTYYKTFPNALTVRIYSIKDYTGFTLPAINGASDLKYRANTNYNIGLGATYLNTSINLSAGFGFINKANDDKGKTKSFDVQLHFFPRKWMDDLTYIHYKGFYAAPEGYASPVPAAYYYRPDIKMDAAGFSAYRNLNYKRLSFRSAFNQNEWIHKSAGSLLLGGGVYYQHVYSNDSSLIPAKVAANFSSDFKDFHYISVGPGVGYAYTLAFAKHFFVLGSAIVNGNILFATDGNGSIKNKKTSFEPSGIFKAAIGYNGNVWNVNIDWAGSVFLVKQANVSKADIFPTGAVRLMVARQIILKKPFRLASSIIHGIFGYGE